MASHETFLGSGRYCKWDADSKLAIRAKKLVKLTARDTIAEVYGFVGGMAYDYVKAVDLAGRGGYVPDPEATYESGKGICFDLASLMCAMLRSVGIPTKLVIGRRDGRLHAWVSAWDGKTWLRCDPTMGQQSAEYETLEEK